MTARLSVDAFHMTLIEFCVVPFHAIPCGTVGACVSCDGVEVGVAVGVAVGVDVGVAVGVAVGVGVGVGVGDPHASLVMPERLNAGVLQDSTLLVNVPSAVTWAS